MEKHIKEALKKAGLDRSKEDLEKQKKYFEGQLKQEDLCQSSREALQRKLEKVKAELKRTNERITEKREFVLWTFVRYCIQNLVTLNRLMVTALVAVSMGLLRNLESSGNIRVFCESQLNVL